MHLDNRNFQEHLELLLTEIEKADFVSFDCQFTGLITQTKQIEGQYSDHVEFYERIKENALNFSLLQLGITLFFYEDGKYIPKSYNCYIKPNNEEQNFNNLLVCQIESLQFLARHGMDFSRIFKHGISYKRFQQKQEEKQKSKLKQGKIKQRGGNKEEQNVTFFCDEDEKLISEIDKIMQNQKQCRIDFKNKKVYQHFRSGYDMSLDKPKKNMGKYQYVIRIYRQSEIQFEKILDQPNIPLNQNQTEVNLKHSPQQNVGIEIILEHIIKWEKPIVGHFPSLDLGLIYNSFINRLPESYEQFSFKMNSLFPYIFDTKIISRRLQNKIKSLKVDLKSLFIACSNNKLLKPFSNIDYRFVQNYISEQCSHEAGYDSFMTGCAFIGMSNYLLGKKDNRIVFAQLQSQNKILYSKFSGQISLVFPFSPRTSEFSKRIVVYLDNDTQNQWEAIGKQLSKFGTLSVVREQSNIYYQFQEQKDIQKIIEQIPCLKHYINRRINKSRNMFTQK